MLDDVHEPAHGGWRRAVIGLVIGAGFGILVRIVVGGADAADG